MFVEIFENREYVVTYEYSNTFEAKSIRYADKKKEAQIV